jgi:hypothetical protein
MDTAMPYKRMSTLKKHITDFGTFPHSIRTCIKICFSLLLKYVCRFDGRRRVPPSGQFTPQVVGT